MKSFTGGKVCKAKNPTTVYLRRKKNSNNSNKTENEALAIRPPHMLLSRSGSGITVSKKQKQQKPFSKKGRILEGEGEEDDDVMKNINHTQHDSVGKFTG